VQITQRTVASFHYTLTNDKQETLDSSSGREPMAYLHGAGNIVAGLEKEMEGKKAGDKFEVTVAPAEGYGERIDALVQTVPREAFQGIDDIAPGMRFRADTQQGPVTVVVTDISDTEVTVDGNHPLAGETLYFAIEVTEVREATAEEVLHGHVHGAGGVDH
jgi:FKBP-type peptidyl-prolyl cis-trans isomerase SlyD